MPQHRLRRQQQCFEVVAFFGLTEPFQRDRRLQSKGPTFRPQQKTHMGGTVQRFAQIVAQSANVEALGAAHLQQRAVVLRHALQFQ